MPLTLSSVDESQPIDGRSHKLSISTNPLISSFIVSQRRHCRHQQSGTTKKGRWYGTFYFGGCEKRQTCYL